jgi:O-antigen/teichoic acid export membrane protein
MVVAPQFAKMYTNGQMEKLQRLATASARVALLIAFPAALVFILFGGDLLNIVVGEEYVTGAIPLAILSLGQLVNAGMGSVIILLNMTDHERVVARGVAFAAIGNVVANLFLIPTWGMKGAAIATTLTLIIWNVFLAREAIKRLGINSTAFGARRIL